VANATAGGADEVNLIAASSSALSFGQALGPNVDNQSSRVTIPNVETVNLTFDDTATTASGFQNTIILNADNMSTLTVTGDAGVNLDNLSSGSNTKLTSINTSGVTAGYVFITTVADDNLTFTGGNTYTRIDASSVTASTATVTKTVSITTGAGNDGITGTASVDIIDSGAGNDNITTAGGNDVITLGAGNDNVTAGADNDTITGGAGNDWIFGGAGKDTMTGGADNDTFIYTTKTESSSANDSVDTITDFGTYDKIDLSDLFANASNFTGVVPVEHGFRSVVTDSADMAFANDNKTRAYLNSTNGKLYIDTDGDGSQDMLIQLTGVTTLDNATNFKWTK